MRLVFTSTEATDFGGAFIDEEFTSRQAIFMLSTQPLVARDEVRFAFMRIVYFNAFHEPC